MGPTALARMASFAREDSSGSGEGLPLGRRSRARIPGGSVDDDISFIRYS